MSLRDKLLSETRQEREARERQEAEERSHSVLHKMVEAMRSLCHLVANDFLGEYEKERLATIRPLTMKVENPALKGVFFPYLAIVARSVEITLKPVGPVLRHPVPRGPVERVVDLRTPVGRRGNPDAQLEDRHRWPTTSFSASGPRRLRKRTSRKPSRNFSASSPFPLRGLESFRQPVRFFLDPFSLSKERVRERSRDRPLDAWLEVPMAQWN